MKLEGTTLGTLAVADILTGTDTTDKLVSAQTINAAMGGYATTAGTGNAYTATIPGFVLQDGARVMLKIHVTTANNPTLNINGTGAKLMRRNGTGGIASGQIYANSVAILVYNSSDNSYYLTNANALGFVDEIRRGDTLASIWTPLNIKTGMMSYAGAVVTTAGTASAYTITDATNYTSTAANLNAGTKVVVKMHLANAAGATLNLNAMGAKDIFYKGAAITAGLLQAGGTYTLVYDGTNWNIVMSPNAGTIPLPTAECASPGNKCGLMYGSTNPDGSGEMIYTWEVVSR